MSVPKKTINEILNARVIDKEKYISEDINYLKDIINKKADVIDMMSPGPLKDELRGTFDPTQETYEEYLQRQAIQQIDRPLTGQLPSDAILETQRIDLKKGGPDPDSVRGTKNPNYVPFTKSEEELAKKYFKSQIQKAGGYQKWLLLPNTKYAKHDIKRGRITEDTVSRGYTNKDPNRIIVRQKRGSDIVDAVDFPDKKTEQKFIKDVYKRYSVPKGTSEISNEYLQKKYPFNSKRQANKAATFIAKKNKLEQPKSTYPGADNYKYRKKLYGDVTDFAVEEQVTKKVKKPILEEKGIIEKGPKKTKGLIDLAHRISKKHANELGIQFGTKNTGLDSRLINQVIVRPSEIRIEKFYEKQRELLNKIKRNGYTPALGEEMKTINRLINNEVGKTNGRIIGVNIDPKTQKISFTGEKKNLRLSNVDKTFKELKKIPFEDRQAFLEKEIRKGIDAQVKAGFRPYDFRKILSDPKNRTTLLKYAKENAPKIFNEFKQALNNPLSKKRLPMYAYPILIGYGVGKSQMEVLRDMGVLDKKRGQPTASIGMGKYVPEEATLAENALATGLGAATVGGGYLGAKKLIEKTTGRFAPMIKGAIGKALQTPFALPFRATGLDRMAMKKLGLLPEDETVAQTYDPRTASGRTALGLEATAASAYRPIAKNLTSGIKDIAKKTLARRILSLGPTANILARVGRVTTPLGVASLLGEGAYQLLVKPQKEYLESLDPEERKTVEQQYADVAAAEGGIIRKAYKDAGLVEKLGRGAAAFDPRNLPYYGAKALKGLGSGVEMAIKFPVAAGAAIGESLQQKPTMETLRKFGEAMQPSATQYLSEKTGLESLIKGQEKELLEKRPGAVTMGDVLELGAEFVAPATGYIKMIEDGTSKLYKVLRNSQSGKKVDPKDIDEVLEVLSDKGVGRRDFMAVVGGTSALALAKHIGLVDAVKILEKVKPVRMLGKSASKMPEWFPNFASRILDDTDSVFKQIEDDVVEITNKNLPDVSISKHSNGRWEVQGYNEYGKPYLIEYEPPTILEGGIKYPGDFSVFDNVPSRMGPDDVEFDSELVESIDDVLGGTSKLEEWTTGVKKKELTKGEKRVIEAEGRAEADYDAWRESEDFVDE